MAGWYHRSNYEGTEQADSHPSDKDYLSGEWEREKGERGREMKGKGEREEEEREGGEREGGGGGGE